MKCWICGSANLQPDPAGYYADARDERGAPYMCVDKRHKEAQDARAKKDYGRAS